MEHQKEALLLPSRKSMADIPFCACWQQHYLTDFISLSVLRVWKGEKGKGKVSLFPPLYQHPDNILAPTTHGKSNMLCKLPGHYFGMLQKTNMQPITSATTSKSELLFALYLYPVCVSTATLCQAVSAALGTACCPWGRATNKSREQVRHRDHYRNSHLMLVLHQQVPTSGTTRGGLKAGASPTGNRKCAKPHWQSCGGAAQLQCCPHIPGISRLLHLHAAITGQTVYTRENKDCYILSKG